MSSLLLVLLEVWRKVDLLTFCGNLKCVTMHRKLKASAIMRRGILLSHSFVIMFSFLSQIREFSCTRFYEVSAKTCRACNCIQYKTFQFRPHPSYLDRAVSKDQFCETSNMSWMSGPVTVHFYRSFKPCSCMMALRNFLKRKENLFRAKLSLMSRKPRCMRLRDRRRLMHVYRVGNNASRSYCSLKKGI